jgi:hypothetical protein
VAFRDSGFIGEAGLVVALHERGQGIEKNFRAVERVDVQFGLVVSVEIVGIEHDRRYMKTVAFSADALAIGEWNSVANHDGADMTVVKDIQRGVSGGHRYDSVSGMRQNRIADGSQHPFCRNRKDCRTHKFFPST